MDDPRRDRLPSYQPNMNEDLSVDGNIEEKGSCNDDPLTIVYNIINELALLSISAHIGYSTRLTENMPDQETIYWPDISSLCLLCSH